MALSNMGPAVLWSAVFGDGFSILHDRNGLMAKAYVSTAQHLMMPSQYKSSSMAGSSSFDGSPSNDVL